jgi:hypothetical protein
MLIDELSGVARLFGQAIFSKKAKISALLFLNNFKFMKFVNK